MSKIFICYRREDTAGYAGRLHDRLLTTFGASSIFRDIDDIEPGVDFGVAIAEAVRACDVLVAVIGNSWSTMTDRAGNRRLDDPDDYVRNEISTALDANLMVIPVLVERATMPGPDELPGPLGRLSRHNAIEVSDERWDYDMKRLITRLEVATSGRDQTQFHISGFEAATVIRSGSGWTLYRARRVGTSRCVTIKVLRAADLSAEAIERLRRDCSTMAELSRHPNLATVQGCGLTNDGHPFVVMEDLDGSCLEDRLQRGGPFPWQEVVAIGRRLADALQAAHSAGLLHCDLSPFKVLLGPANEPLLADFVLARLENEASVITSGVLARVAHTAPEVLTTGAYSMASDVYSLGSTLYTFLAGAPAFLGDGDGRFVAMVARATTAPAPDLRPLGVPDSVCSVIERAMAKAPEDRWPSAGDLGLALKGAQRKEMGLEDLAPPIEIGDSATAGTASEPATPAATLADSHPTGAPPTIAPPTIAAPSIAPAPPPTPTVETAHPAPPTLDLPTLDLPPPPADSPPTVDTPPPPPTADTPPTTPTVDPPPPPPPAPPPIDLPPTPAPPTPPIDKSPTVPEPVPAVEPPAAAAGKKSRRAWLVAAAVVLVVGGGTAIAMRGGGGTTSMQTSAANIGAPAAAPSTTAAAAPVVAKPVVHFSVVDKVLPDDKADDVELTIDDGPTVRFAGSPDGGVQPHPLTVTEAGKHHYKLSVVTTTKTGVKSTVTGSGNLDVQEGRQFDVGTVANTPGFVCLALEGTCQDE